MATSTASPSPSPAHPEPVGPADGTGLEEHHGPRTWFWVTLACVAALMGGWAYLLFFYDPGLMIDELADRTFPTQAEQVCAAAVEQLDALPPANLATSATDRADTVEQSNVVLRQMVEDLRPLVPAEPRSGDGLSAAERKKAQQVHDGINEWLDDWGTYIGDREQYVDGLREDPDTRFLESKKSVTNKGITRAINGFAEVNEMTSCTSPADLS
jgi:hypothetical protein